MSKPSWAAIVQKPTIYTNSTIQSVECHPMNVVVPDPPMLNVEFKAVVEKSFETLLEEISIQKSKIDEETELKSDKFHKSYAYTRFSQEMDALSNARKLLEEKELEIKRAIILSESIFSKKVLEVILRVKAYLGENYENRYTGYNAWRSMYYSYAPGAAYNFSSDNGEGLRVSIIEGLDIDYEFPNKIELHFTVESDDMIPVIEAAIQEHLKGFRKNE